MGGTVRTTAPSGLLEGLSVPLLLAGEGHGWRSRMCPPILISIRWNAAGTGRSCARINPKQRSDGRGRNNDVDAETRRFWPNLRPRSRRLPEEKGFFKIDNCAPPYWIQCTGLYRTAHQSADPPLPRPIVLDFVLRVAIHSLATRSHLSWGLLR